MTVPLMITADRFRPQLPALTWCRARGEFISTSPLPAKLVPPRVGTQRLLDLE
jgi:hypothetical protein